MTFPTQKVFAWGEFDGIGGDGGKGLGSNKDQMIKNETSLKVLFKI